MESVVDLLEALTGGVDDRFGRAAAWIVAVLGLLAILVLLAVCLYLLR